MRPEMRSNLIAFAVLSAGLLVAAAIFWRKAEAVPLYPCLTFSGAN